MDFWKLLFDLLIIVPLTICWLFGIFDIFSRPDLRGWTRAGWLLFVLILPLIGTLIYLVLRPTNIEVRARSVRRTVDEGPAGRPEQLKLLADLHDAGKLTDAEFARAKARALGISDVNATGAA
jgi:hypothetical protein